MKISLKQFSKSTLSVVLAFCLLFSCATVGLVATDAAQVDGDSVGYSEHNLDSTNVFYFDNSATQWSSVKLMVMKKNGGSWSGGPWDLTQVSGSNYWKWEGGQSWNGYTHYLFYSGEWGNTTQTEDIEGQLATNSWYTNCFTPVAQNNNKYTGSFSKCVGVKNFSVTTNNATSGSGTSSDPYIVTAGASVTLTASSNQIDSNYTTQYSFDDGTNYATTTTSTFTATSNANTSFNKAVKVRTNRGSYYSSVETKTVYFRTAAAETMYTVSVATESGGTLSSNASLNAGANTAANLPTATPKYGYKFKNWTATTGLTITNSTNASGATVKATQAGTVTAHYEADTNMALRIAGRFHVKRNGNWVNTFDGTGNNDWTDTGADNIPFVHDSGTVYKVETNASVHELSTEISKADPYFFVYDKNEAKAWHSNGSNTKLKSSQKTADLSTNDSSFNVRFDDTSDDDTPVTIYFDVDTKQLRYSTPTYYTITCNTATGGSVSASPGRQKQGESVTLTINPSTGYQLSGITAKDSSNNTVSLSGSGDTRTFTMPASNVTVTPTFSKINYTLTKASTTNGSFTLSPDSSATYQQTVIVTCSPSANYEVDTVTYKQTGSSGSGTAVTISNNSGSFSMPAYNTTVTVTFKEKLYPITVQTNDSNKGTVVCGTTTVSGSTTYIGNVTAVTLVATSKSGYEFDHWTVVKSGSNQATTATVNGNAVTLTASEQTISGATATSNFKFNGTATVKAYFKPTKYSLSAQFTHNNQSTWNSNSVSTTDTSGNAKDSLNINDYFEVRITLADGYVLNANPTFQTGTGYITPTLQSGYPTTSGSVVTYRYQATTAGMVLAKVTLKAATPSLSGVRIKNNTQLNVTNPSSWQTYSANGTVPHYYKQPVEATATTDSFSTLSYATKKTDNTALGSDTSTPCSIAANTTIIPATADGYVDYKLTITATNAPAGVTEATTSQTFTIRVYFNNAQKAHFNLRKLIERCIENPDTSYFKSGAPIAAYQTAYQAAETIINTGYPAYDASSSETTAQQSAYNDLHSRFVALKSFFKTTTVYVLTQYASSASNPINLHVWSSGDTAWKHFKMHMMSFDSNGNPVPDSAEVSNDTYHMSYDSTYTVGNNTRYLYKITYAGHVNFIVWRGNSASDTSQGNKQLTGNITGATDFKNYYINVHNVSAGSGSGTSIADYVDFDVRRTTNKKVCFQLTDNGSKTAAQILSEFNFTNYSSLVTSPGITVTNTTFTVAGPVGKANPQTYNMLASGATFPTTRSGRYSVTYTVRFTKEGTTREVVKTVNTSLWVALDEISIYVDMNENVGNPILNFRYYTNSNGTPVVAGTSGAVTAYLPYEMDLVTGSESIYKYTIKTSKLRNDYKMTIDDTHPIKVNYIMVEGAYINTDGKFASRPLDADIESKAFTISTEAEITGESWYKADSTNLKTFNQISYGSVTSSFLAVDSSTNGLLSSAITRLHGTGINTDDINEDDNEILHNKYAGLYMIDESDDTTDNPTLKNNFKYVLSAGAAEEVSYKDNNTTTYYYFDKWIAFPTPVEGLNISNKKLTYPTGELAPQDYSNKADLTFTKARYFDKDENIEDGLEDGDYGDYTYVAVYKPVVSGDSTVRVEVTYEFRDYDTSDGNYIYDAEKDTVKETYTKTIKVPLGELYAPTNTTYANFAAVNANAALNAIASANAPYIKSNYFDYTFTANSVSNIEATAAQSKIKVKATMTETAHTYTIIVKNGSNAVVGSPHTGNYQQTVELTAPSGVSNPVWKDSKGNIIGSGETYTARFVSSGFETSDGTPGGTDCQIIKVEAGTENASYHTSVVTNSTTTVENNGTNEILHHNFYIVDYCQEGELVGGGVLFATTDSSGKYRQTNASAVLEEGNGKTAKENRESFIGSIIGIYNTNNDLEGITEDEYAAQTINNVGFRYKPFKDTEDVFRYSDIQNQKAYQTVYEGTNVNSANYQGQKLRLFSFMVYKTVSDGTTTYTIVSSEGYGEVDRYITHNGS